MAELRWLWLACVTAVHIWDDEAWERLSARYLELVRQAGALCEHALALSMRAQRLLLGGQLTASESLVAQAKVAAEATGGTLAPYGAPHRDVIAVTPAIGPVPAIYIPQPPARASTRSGHAPTGEEVTVIPADLRYSDDHLWARAIADGSVVRVGVTDLAQQSLGDVVQVTLPRPGETVKAGEACGDIESTKSVNDLVAPVTGTVRARHDDLADTPELVNTDPYGRGWMFEVETDPATLGQQIAALMDARAYSETVGA